MDSRGFRVDVVVVATLVFCDRLFWLDWKD